MEGTIPTFASEIQDEMHLRIKLTAESIAQVLAHLEMDYLPER